MRLTQYSAKHYVQLVAASVKWYSAHLLSKNICVYLLTNSDPSKYTAHLPSEFVLTTDQFIKLVLFVSFSFSGGTKIETFNRKFIKESPEIQEYISITTATVPELDSVPELQSISFTEYLPESELHKQINEGTLLIGRLNINRLNPQKGSVRIFGLDQEIFINGAENLNRAINFDTVAVRVLPESSNF